MVVRVRIAVVLVVSDRHEERGYDRDDVEEDLKLGQFLLQQNECEDHCEDGRQLLNYAYHAQTEEGHRVVPDELREDALEDAERQRQQGLDVDVRDQMLLYVLAHVETHHDYCGEAPEEEELEGAHVRVPGSEEFACDQVVRREQGVEEEVEDSPSRVVRRHVVVLHGHKVSTARQGGVRVYAT